MMRLHDLLRARPAYNLKSRSLLQDNRIFLSVDSVRLAKTLVFLLVSSSLLGARCLPVPRGAHKGRTGWRESDDTSSLTPYAFDDVQYNLKEEDTSFRKIIDVNERLKAQGASVFQGDIIMRKDESLRLKRAAMTSDQNLKWDNATVPYAFDPMFPVEARKKVLRAISHWHKKTCIRFIPHSIEPYFIRFTIAGSCISDVGKREATKFLGQEVYLTEACAENRGNIIHELGHVVGLWHEVTRFDRDQYIEINWKNIRSGARIWYNPLPKHEIDYLGVPYDLGSIMHFRPEEYAKDGRKVFTVRENVTFTGEIGQRNGLSYLDTEQVRLFYNCPPDTPPGPEPESLDVIRAGQKIAFKALDTDRHLWLGCNNVSCSMDTCPGRRFKGDELSTCEQNVFAFYNVDNSTRMLVGNKVVLRSSMNMSSGDAEIVLCEESSTCYSSTDCAQHIMGQVRCMEQVFVITVPGKTVGEELRDNDLIILSYDCALPGTMQWLTCDTNENSCERVLCTKEQEFFSSGLGLNPSMDVVPCSTIQSFEVIKLP